MKFHKQSPSSEKGFIYIASLRRMYYHMAVYSAHSLKDYYPDANITLFTHQDFLDKQCEVFDNVVTEIPVYYRTKMWAMARTPYDKTVYLDADSFVAHRDIKTLFNELNDECDMMFGPVLPYTTADIAWSYMDLAMTEVPRYHGAVCIYKKNNLTIDFMNTWYEEYIKQVTTPWAHGANHDKKWRIFDMFTLWRMTSGKFPEFDRFLPLKIKQGSQRITITAQHSAKDKDRPIIHLMDSHTWGRITEYNKLFASIENDPVYNTKNFPVGKVPTTYN